MKKNYYMNFINIIVVFLYIFNFTIPIIKNSYVLSILISIIFIIGNRKISTNYITIFYKNKYTLYLFLYLFILILLSIFRLIPNSDTLQYSFLLPRLVQLIYIGLLPIPLIYLFIQNINLEKYLLIIINVFLLQSIIQIIAFIFPQVQMLISYFHPEIFKELLANYEGIRGLALAGNLFFSLSSIYGLVYIIYIYYITEYSKSFNFKNIVVFMILVIGGLFTGRTSIIGLTLSIFLYLLINKTLFYKINNSIKILGYSFLILSIAILLLPNSISNIVFNKLLPFAFEFIYSYQNSNKISTSSTNHLISMLSVPLDPIDYIFGRGAYMNSDGTYYMHTDSGYFRQILFWGIPGLTLTLAYQIHLIFYPVMKKTNVWNINNYKLFLIIVFVYTLILQIKGEVFAHMHYMSIILYSISMFFIKDKLIEFKNNHGIHS